MKFHASRAVKALADFYASAPEFAPPASLRALSRAEAHRMFNLIPIPVTFVDGEPYQTAEQLFEDIDGRNCMKVSNYAGYVSPVWGEDYRFHRAAHDYFGHYAHHAQFGVAGEIVAFIHHRAQMDERVLPFVWNDIVLANSYVETYGKSLDRIVLDQRAFWVGDLAELGGSIAA